MPTKRSLLIDALNCFEVTILSHLKIMTRKIDKLIKFALYCRLSPRTLTTSGKPKNKVSMVFAKSPTRSTNYHTTWSMTGLSWFPNPSCARVKNTLKLSRLRTWTTAIGSPLSSLTNPVTFKPWQLPGKNGMAI